MNGKISAAWCMQSAAANPNVDAHQPLVVSEAGAGVCKKRLCPVPQVREQVEFQQEARQAVAPFTSWPSGSMGSNTHC